MNKLLVATAFLVGVFTGLLVGKSLLGKGVSKNLQKAIDRSLDKYTIENLSRAPIEPTTIRVEKTLKDNTKFTFYLVSFSFDPTLRYNSGQALKKVTGVMNTPKGTGPFPVVVMLRGYVDQKIYQSGEGTKRAAEVFAQNGFITVAPDFLGYAGSDKEAGDVFESRFQTYTTVLTLISSLQSIKQWDKKNLFLWGHSNGGQIALTILEITQKEYPTTLWAPLTKPFPYSILVYSDEATDSGKFLRGKLANFEDTYDTDLYSLTNYLDRIKAPIQFHQGTADDAVRVDWSDAFVKKLKDLGISITYFKYLGGNHNLTPGWDTVVARDLTFFKNHIKNNF